MYHLVNLGSSGMMLSPPTASNTLGVISPPAMSASSAPEESPRPVYLYPVAVVNAGAATFSLRNCSDEAYATLAVPFGAALDGEDEEEPDEPEDEELHPAATNPAKTIVSIGICQDRIPRPAAPACESMFVRALKRGVATMPLKIATCDCAAQEDLTSRSRQVPATKTVPRRSPPGLRNGPQAPGGRTSRGRPWTRTATDRGLTPDSGTSPIRSELPMWVAQTKAFRPGSISSTRIE